MSNIYIRNRRLYTNFVYKILNDFSNFNTKYISQSCPEKSNLVHDYKLYITYKSYAKSACKSNVCELVFRFLYSIVESKIKPSISLNEDKNELDSYSPIMLYYPSLDAQKDFTMVTETLNSADEANIPTLSGNITFTSLNHNAYKTLKFTKK